MADQERSKKLRKAYGDATARLREAHRPEFDDLLVEEARKQGVDYKPRPTPEAKAKEQLEAILSEFPDLRNEVVQGQNPPQ